MARSSGIHDAVSRQELKIGVGAAGHVLTRPAEDLQVARETYVKPVEELRKTATEYVGKAQRAFDAALESKHRFDHWAEDVCLSTSGTLPSPVLE